MNTFQKLLFPIVVVFMVIVGFLYSYIPQIIAANTVRQAVASSEHTVTQFKILRDVYSKTVLSEILAHTTLSVGTDVQQDNGVIPLPATLVQEISRRLHDKGTQIRLYSPHPFPNRKDRQLDEFGTTAWEALSKDPTSTYFKEYHSAGKSYIRVAVSDVLSNQTCVNCHNQITVPTGTQWKIGDLRGILEVKTDITQPIQNGIVISRHIIFALLVGLLSITLTLLITYRAAVQKRLTACITAMDKIANSDGICRDKLPEAGNDDIGHLSQTFNKMSSRLNASLQSLKQERTLLDNKVKTRTRELEVATQHANNANKAKSQFLAVMSHELRTPLNGMLGMAQIMSTSQQSEQQPEQQRQLNILLESGQHLLSLLNDILDFSKIEQNKLELEIHTFQLADLIEPIEATYKPICHKKNLAFDLNTTLPLTTMLRSDKSRIRQVIYNILSNAVKFTESGGIDLSIHTEKCGSCSESLLVVTISDSGIGIRKERLKHIFEPFTQAESSTTRCYGGTGLGLAIVKQLTGLMSGSARVESTLGKGTTFTVSMRVDIIDSQRNEQAESLTDSTPASEPLPEKLKVLIVEDNKINAMVAQSFCQRLGYRVTIAKDGSQAIDTLRQEHFDLILMDNHMPTMDGLTATKIIRQQLKLDTIIFACTADILKKNQNEFLDAGADTILSKPILDVKFRETLRQFSRQFKEQLNQQTVACSTATELISYRKLIEQCDGNERKVLQLLQHFITSMSCEYESLPLYYRSDSYQQLALSANNIRQIATDYRLASLKAMATYIVAVANTGNPPKLEVIRDLSRLMKKNIEQASYYLHKPERKSGVSTSYNKLQQSN
ncbi:hypothetical protein BIT28_02755 [Photobacterium proteolyticum]|uniref:histidine kinase n=1 Tax=Photobacterium proteolyticum TaxID=1903952 RepID=A0A1Q9GA11_9GAMM|nr:ATP-binding protein [Photobacterium proteolyticum]OLQ71110.1 hypothetical protein BIT28_02755 [Photobacterium proteolyticum]